MIDFHTHILPGIDDGSDSVETSLAMLRREFQQGIHTAVLTPHFYADENSPETFLKKRREAWQQLSPRLEADMPRLLLGAEVQYFEGICSVESIRELRIEGSGLLLLEMPFCRWTNRMVADVLELNAWEDTRVVLAHFERYLSMQPRAVWETLEDSGVWLQSNVSFFTRWKTRHKAMKMLSRGQIQFLGSDCHSMGSRCPNWDRLPAKAAALWEQGETGKAVAALAARRD